MEWQVVFRCTVGIVMGDGILFYQAWRQPNVWKSHRVGQLREDFNEAVKDLMIAWLTECGL